MLLDENIKQFIEAHQHLNSKDVALKLSKQSDLPKNLIINQINGRQKAQKKLPQFYTNEQITYPNPLSMEQCSSEITGKYKSEIVTGNTLVDLTAGFGVDSFFFAQAFNSVVSVESNTDLTEIIQHNLDALNVSNIQVENTSAEEFIETNEENFDVIFIDPSRRVDAKKVHGFSDCEPNVLELEEQLFKLAPQVLIKASPLLDIKKSIDELSCVKEVHVVSVANDCKELLLLLENGFEGEAQIKTINFADNQQVFDFTFSEEIESNSSYSEPLTYLYEPNSAILKAGAFKSVGNKHNLKKIAQHTHLYTSETLENNFPGRSFMINHVVTYNKKEFKKLGITKANISTRNFDDKPELVKKKLKLKDGGETYIFACKNKEDKPVILVCRKI